MTRIADPIPDAPQPGGPYSASARIGRIVAVAGQCGYLPDRSLAAALGAAGATMDDVLSVDVFLANGDDFADMNAVYERQFTPPFPARTTVTAGLRPGVLVEFSALAVLDHEVNHGG
jgi:2-iminobutanoate/2-iminopropanoate deaminase